MTSEELTELLKSNSFELFNLPIEFQIDPTTLEAKYHSLQKQIHPDNFSVNRNEEKLLATSLSSKINDAYQTLASPIKRAKLILELNGLKINLAENNQLPENFLIEQMETHETIAEANDDIDKLDAIIYELEQKKDHLIAQIEEHFVNENLQIIVELIKQLSFYDKLILLVENNIQNAL